MIVYYDSSDIGKVVAVYSCAHSSRAWDAFSMVVIPGAKLCPGCELGHHKVVTRPNPNYPINRGPEPGPGEDDRRHPQVPETLATLEEMSADEKAAHPIPAP